MAIRHGFWNSQAGDRKYSADDMLKPIGLIVSDGIIANETGLSEALKVKYYSGLELRVCAGSGFFGKKWFEMTADETITIPTPHTQYTRIDSVVIRVDEDSRTISLEYLQGTPGENPQPPEIQRSESIKEYRLANISVAANTTEVTQSNIEDTRPSADCGVVTNLLQNSDISATYSQWESQFIDFMTENQTKFDEKLNELSGIDASTVLDLSRDVAYLKTDVNTLTNTSNDTVEKVENIEENLVSINSDLAELKRGSSLLWQGGDTMGTDSVVTPSKPLTTCKNGWILVWSAYDADAGTAGDTRINTTIVPKGLLNLKSKIDVTTPIVYALGAAGVIEQAAKRVYVDNYNISGYAGNTAGLYNGNVCLRAVFEY